MGNTKDVEDQREGGVPEDQTEIDLVIPDFIEIESKKTKMYKMLAEGFCYKTPGYSLSWKVSPCMVDLKIKSPLFQNQEFQGGKQIKHQATLHTLKYDKGRITFQGGLRREVETSCGMNQKDYYIAKENYYGYKPPKIFDIGGDDESVETTADIDSLDNMEDLRNYIKANMCWQAQNLFMDVELEGYVNWLQNWLHEYSEHDYKEYERKDDTFLVDFSKYSSLSEVSLEIYNCIRSSDLSLDQLNSYINKLGIIISQSDLRAISTQPRSKMSKMFSVIFESGDISNIMLECIKENSYAYVYLLIRVLFEIILYTKSTPVRAFAYGQIMKNKEVIKGLMGLSYKPSSVALNKIRESEWLKEDYRESESDNKGRNISKIKEKEIYKFLENYNLEYEGKLCFEESELDKYTNPMGDVGFPNSNFSQNMFEILLLEMLQSRDLNLCLMGIQLTSVVPTISAKSPQILKELYLFLLGDDDELSYLSGTSLSQVLKLVPEIVALNFIKGCYSNVLEREDNYQRVKTFTMLTLSCKEFKSISKYIYRMIWAVYLKLDKHKLSDLAHSILTELKIGLVMASSIVSEKEEGNQKRQEKILEEMVRQQLNELVTSNKGEETNYENNRTNLLFLRGLIYSLFLMYFAEETDDELMDKLLELTNITVNNTPNPNKYVNMDLLTEGVDPLMEKKNRFISFVYYGTCLKHLEYFVKNNSNSVFATMLDLFTQSLQYRKENIQMVFNIKRCIKYVKNPCTLLLKIFGPIQGHVDELEVEFRVKVLKKLMEVIEYSFLTDLENFENFVNKYKEMITNNSLKLIMRPLVQIQSINPESILYGQDILVHHLYSCVNNEVVTETFITRPVVMDFGRGLTYLGESNVTVVVVKPKFNWGSEYKKILKNQIKINFLENVSQVETCNLYSNMYKVGLLCLRLGFYEEATNIFRRISFVSDKFYVWVRALFKLSESSLGRKSEGKGSGVEEMERYLKDHIKSVKNLMGLLKIIKTTNTIKSQQITNKTWDYGHNYQLPSPMLHSYVTLTLCTKLAIGDLMTSMKDRNYEVSRFIKLFKSLKASFKAMEFLFSEKSKETMNVLSCYQGIATIVVQVLRKNNESKDKKIKEQGGLEEEETDILYFWKYLSEFKSNLEKPDIAYIMEVFPKVRRKTLMTNLFTKQKIMPKNKKGMEKKEVKKRTNIIFENKTFQMEYSEENVEVTYETIWQEMVGSMKITTKNEKVYTYHRDVPTFNEINQYIQTLSQNYSEEKFIAFLEYLMYAEIPTPLGVLKAFPLPFVSLTATIQSKERGESELQTIKVTGNLRNFRENTNVTHVLVRMVFEELDKDKIFYKTFKLVEDSVSGTILVKVGTEVCKSGTFMAVPLDRKFIPRGVPCPVVINQKFI